MVGFWGSGSPSPALLRRPRTLLQTLWDVAVSSILPDEGSPFVEKLKAVRMEEFEKVVHTVRDLDPKMAGSMEELLFQILKSGLVQFCAEELEEILGEAFKSFPEMAYFRDTMESTKPIVMSLTLSELKQLLTQPTDTLGEIMQQFVDSNMELFLIKAVSEKLNDAIPKEVQDLFAPQKLKMKHILAIARMLRSQKILEWTGTSEILTSVTELMDLLREPWSLLLRLLKCSSAPGVLGFRV